MNLQTTLKQSVKAVGRGLHSGDLITLTLRPAPVDSGVVFVRTDQGGARIPAHIDHVDFNALQLATTLKSDDIRIQTTEHVMSALAGRGIDNALVEVDGAEVPIMDGSAEPFLILIDEAGIRKQAKARRVLRITKPFHFEHNGKSLSVKPCREFRVTYDIAFDHPLIRRQCKTVVVKPSVYEGQVARARTFGFLKDVNALKKMGLVRGGSLDNAIVLDGDRMLNDSLRLEQEFVCHKILDFIGDIALAGMRLKGHFHACKAGHEVHARFLRALIASPDHYTIDEVERPAKPVASSLKPAMAAAL